jgi:tetratricopeptide (TPR) repeat protein
MMHGAERRSFLRQGKAMESASRNFGPVRSEGFARGGAALACAAAFAASALMLGACGTRGAAGASGGEAVIDSGEGGDFVAAAEAAVRAGDKRRALLEFSKAIEKNPRLTTAHMGMADIYRLDGDYGKAEQGYRKAAEIEPRSFDAQYYHGLMLHVLNRVSEAVGAYLRALSIRPDDQKANLNLGAAYYQLAEYAQALPYASRAVALDPKSGPARFSLGAVYAGLGRHSEAIAEYEQALDSSDTDMPSQLLMNLAASYGATSRFAEMRNTLQRLIKLQPAPAAFERLGFAEFRLENIPAALSAYREALKIDPDYFPALNGVGVCELNTYLWSDKNDTQARDRAFEALRRSLRLKPNQPKVQDLLTRYAM